MMGCRGFPVGSMEKWSRCFSFHHPFSPMFCFTPQDEESNPPITTPPPRLVPSPKTAIELHPQLRIQLLHCFMLIIDI